jgi:alpha-tubulin suppressor-like RCC1 family protein
MRTPLVAATLAAVACGDAGGPAAHTFVPVSAGAYHACALTADGAAWCWGANTYGALGDGGTSPSPVPVRVAATTRFTALTSSLQHTCALAVDRRAWCWGINLNGQLGDGSWDRRRRVVLGREHPRPAW